MRPPILFLAVAFGVGLWAGLDPFVFSGAALWGVAVSLVATSGWLAARAPLGGAVGIMGVAGMLWGTAAVRERDATCTGRWAAGGRAGEGHTRAVIARLADPAPAQGGIVDAEVLPGTCGGSVRLRWPEDHAARGGTTWAVAGKWSGVLLVVRRMRVLDPVPRGRGALRDALAAKSTELFGARAPIVNALVFAPNARLDSDIRERYVRSGLAHLLSISGLHVGFIAAWLTLILSKLHLAARARFGATAVLLLGYLWLLGFPAPAVRAGAMLVLADVARLRERVVAPRGVVALAALGVLVQDPWALQSVGAWLSVAGVAVPGLVMALALSWLGSGLAHLIAAGAGLGLALLDLVAHGAALVPGGHIVMVAGWQAALLWAAVAAAAWWLWNSPRRPWLMAARLAFCATVVVATSFRDVVSLDACRCLTVHFLDVGQGDAAALRTPNGRWIVIDGGPRTPERDAGRRVVVPFLRDQGVGRVAVVVATHGDADHLGGLPAVVEAFPPELVLEPGEPLGRPLYLEFLAGVEASGARWHGARAGDRVEVDSVVLEVLSPDSLWLRLPLDVNDHGVVLRVRYGAVRLLFQADAGLPVEGRLAGRVGRVDLLKVGHHGSRTATSDEWLDELAPREAVISVGRNNHYGHPAPEVLERLARHGITVFRTDRSGTITFSTDGHGERVRSHHD